jgi:hypothetical protein
MIGTGTERLLARGHQRTRLDKLLLRLVVIKRAAMPADLGTLRDYGVGVGGFRRARGSASVCAGKPGEASLKAVSNLAGEPHHRRYHPRGRRKQQRVARLREILQRRIASVFRDHGAPLTKKFAHPRFLRCVAAADRGPQIALKAAIAAIAELARPPGASGDVTKPPIQPVLATATAKLFGRLRPSAPRGSARAAYRCHGTCTARAPAEAGMRRSFNLTDD